MYTHKCAYTHTHTDTHTLLLTDTHTHVCTQACIHTHTLRPIESDIHITHACASLSTTTLMPLQVQVGLVCPEAGRDWVRQPQGSCNQQVCCCGCGVRHRHLDEHGWARCRCPPPSPGPHRPSFCDFATSHCQPLLRLCNFRLRVLMRSKPGSCWVQVGLSCLFLCAVSGIVLNGITHHQRHCRYICFFLSCLVLTYLLKAC
jgi:hypothetical protein